MTATTAGAWFATVNDQPEVRQPHRSGDDGMLAGVAGGIAALALFTGSAAPVYVAAFATMNTELTGQDLLQWMAAAREAGPPGISSFAKGLERDLNAVTYGLTTSWSSGSVEGHVNRMILWNQNCQGEPSQVWHLVSARS
jgi:hypothetical protein